jgi:nitrogen fixation/metabolism regulation signal transduction histidine kinase
MKQMVDNFRDYARTPPAVLAHLQLNDLVSEVLTLYGIEEGKARSRWSLPSCRRFAATRRNCVR